jgi:hypothetical protein
MPRRGAARCSQAAHRSVTAASSRYSASVNRREAARTFSSRWSIEEPRSRAIPSALGRDHDAFGVRSQRLGDQLLAHVRTIGISRVYEVDAQLDGPAKNGERGVRVLGRPPDSVTGDAHRAEAETVDCHFTAQPNRSTGTRGQTALSVVHVRSPRVFLITWPIVRRSLAGRSASGDAVTVEAPPPARRRVPRCRRNVAASRRGHGVRRLPAVAAGVA